MDTIQGLQIAAFVILLVVGQEWLIRRKAREERGLQALFQYRLLSKMTGHGRVAFYDTFLVYSSFLQRVIPYDKVRAVKCSGSFVKQMEVVYSYGPHGFTDSFILVDNTPSGRDRLAAFLLSKCPAANLS